MTKNKKLITNLLTTVSAIAVLSGGILEAQGAAAKQVTGAAILSTGVGLTPGGGAFTDDSTLEFGGQFDVTANIANINISAIDTHGFDLTGQSFRIIQDTAVGSIVDLSNDGKALQAAKAANKLKMFLPGNLNPTLTLTGTASNAVGFTAAQLTAPADNYSALGEVDFSNKSATLRINTNSTNPITLDNAVASNARNATLKVDTDLVVKSNTFAQVKNFNIGAAKKLSFDVGNNDITTIAASTYAFGNGDSTLEYKVDVNGGSKNITLNNSITKTGGGDEGFTMNIESGGVLAPGNSLTVNNALIPLTIGTDKTNRLKELKISGANDLTFGNNISVFSKKITTTNTATTTFTKELDSGAASSLEYGATGTVKLLGNSTITTVDFASNAGTLALGANVTLTGAILSNGGPNGTLNILGATTSVTGAIGTVGNEVATINVGLDDGAESSTTFNSTVNATTLNVGGQGNGANNGAKGTLRVDGATKLNTLQIGGAGGAGGAGVGGEGVATFASTLDAATINVGGAGTAGGGVGGAGTATFNNAITHAGGVAINVGGATNGGIAGGLGRVNFNHDVGAAGNDATIEYLANDSVVTLGGAGRTITGTINNSTNKTGTKLIILGGTDATKNIITGAVGAAHELAEISVGGNATAGADGQEGAVQFNAAVKATTVNVGGTGLDAKKGGNGTVVFDQAFNLAGATINIGGQGATGNIGVGGEGVAIFSQGVNDAGIIINVGGKGGNAAAANRGAAGGEANLTLGAGAASVASTLNIGGEKGTDAGATRGGDGGVGWVTLEGDFTGTVNFRNLNSGVLLKDTKKITGAVDNTSGLDLAAGGAGAVVFEEAGEIDGAIGATNALAVIRTLDKAVTLGGNNAVRVYKLLIDGTGTVTRGAALTTVGTIANRGGVVFDAEGVLTLAGDLTGDIDFKDKSGTVNLSGGGTITGALRNNGGTAAKGLLNFGAGGGTVDGPIGSATPNEALEKINFNHASAVTLEGGDSYATEYAYTADANVTAKKNMNGRVNFAGTAGKLTLEGAELIGDITSTAANAELHFTGGAGGVTGDMASVNGLAKIGFDVAGNISLKGNSKATLYEYTQAANVVTEGNMTGDVDFKDKDGSLAIGDDNLTITGAIQNTGGTGPKGTLFVDGTGAVVTRAVGGAGNDRLKLISVGTDAVGVNAGVNADITFNQLVQAQEITIGGNGSDGVNGANNGVRGGRGDAIFELGVSGIGTLNIGGKGGDADGDKEGGKGGDAEITVNTNLGVTTINLGGEAGTDDGQTKGGAGGKGKLIFDTNGGNHNWDHNVNFNNADSEVYLTNSGGADRTITLKGVNIAPSGGKDAWGTVTIESDGTNKLTINTNAGEKLGTDKTHRLKELNITGNKEAKIESKIFAKTINISNTKKVVFQENPIYYEFDTGDNGVINITAKPDDGIIFGYQTNTPKINTSNIPVEIKATSLYVDQITKTSGPGATLTLQAHNSRLVGYTNNTLVSIDLARINVIPGNGNTATLAGGSYQVTELQAGNVGTVTLENGFDLTGGINLSGGAAANFNFDGNGSITGSIGADAGANPAGEISVGNGGTLTLGSNVDTHYNASNFKGFENGGNKTSTLKFVGTGLATVNAGVGDTTAFNIIEFNGGPVKFTDGKTIAAEELKFSSATGSTITIGDNDISAIPIEVTDGAGLHKLIITENQEFNQAVGAANALFGTVHMASNHTITINTTDFYADLTTKTDAEGEVDINAADVEMGNIGLIGGNKFSQVTFSETASVKDIATFFIEVEGNETATFKGRASFQEMELKDGATATFEKDFTGGKIDPETAGNGTVNFEGAADIKGTTTDGELGGDKALLAVNFNADRGQAINLEDNITAGNIRFKKSKTRVTKDNLVLEGATTFNGTDITLEDKDLILKGGSVTFTGDVTMNTTVVNNHESLGNLVADRGAVITLTGADKLTVNIDTTDPAVDIRDNDKVILIKAVNGGNTDAVNIANITPNFTRFTEWVVSKENGNIILSAKVEVKEVLDQIRDEAGISKEQIPSETNQVIEESVRGTDVFAFKKMIESGQMSDAQVNEANIRLDNSIDVPATDIVTGVMDSVEENIGSRIGSFVDISSFAFSGGLGDQTSSFNTPSFNAPAIEGASPAALPVQNLGAPATGGAPTGTVFAPSSSGAGNSVAPSGGVTPATGGPGSENSTDSSGGNKPATGGGAGGAGGAVPATGKNTKKVSDSGAFSGIAAGDDLSRFGLWVAPVYSDSTQKTTKSAAGFRARSAGATFGFDTKVNDDTIVGMAASIIYTNARFKGFKAGDKSKMDSLLFSIYGMKQFTNNFFGQSVFTFGSTRVHTKEQKIFFNQKQIAEGKYSSMSFGAEVLGGYNHIINNKFVATPMLGLDYKRINDSSYTETGTTFQNRKVTKKAFDKISLVAGLRLSSAPFTINGMDITPEIHGFIRHALTNKKAKVTLDLDSGTGKTFAKDSFKPTRTHGSVGIGVNARYSNMLEYGMGYDLNLAKKFVGHQGSLKIRVNF